MNRDASETELIYLNDLIKNGRIVFFSLKPTHGYPFSSISSNAEALTGFSQDDVNLGLFITDLVFIADKYHVVTCLDEIVKSGGSRSIECNIVFKGGQRRWVSLFCSAYQNSSGETEVINGYIKDISEAQELNSRLNTVLSTIPNGLIELDTDCIIEHVNHALAQIYGYSEQELTGKSLSILLDETSGKFVVDNFKSAAKTEALPTRFTHTHVKKSGEKIYVELSWGYKKDENGRITGFVCSITDVTDKKTANDRLVKQVDFLHHIIESVANPFYVIDASNMDVVIANSTSGGSTGIKCHDLLHHSKKPCIMEGYDCPFEAVVKTRKPVTVEHIHYDKNNRPQYYEIHGHPVFDSRGNVIQMIEYTQDITDRKNAQRELEKYKNHLEILVEKRTEELNSTNMQLLSEIEERIEKEQQLILAASVLENTIEGITITDAAGVIQQVNPAFSSITGYRPDEAIGKTPRILKSDRHDETFYRNMWQSLFEQGSWSGEIWNRRKNGETYPEWLSINAIKDHSGQISYFVAVFHDISEIKSGEEKLKYQAHHDTLTGLPNRQLFNDRLEMALAYAKRHRTKVAVIFIDLDNFKNVNDTLGHYVGDLLLRRVADILSGCVRLEDTVARLGGDEFMIILQDIYSQDNATETAKRILREFSQPVNINDNEFFINSSIGITIFPEDGTDVLTLVKNADMAMYRVKETGKNSFQLFTSTLTEKLQCRVTIEKDLRKALNDNEFEVYYQPKVCISTGKITGAEALIRWHRDGELVPPVQFIPTAEETGHIIAIGETVMRQACADMAKWHCMGFSDLSVAVNLSARQFKDESSMGIICDIIDDSGLPPSSVEIEITENTMMEDIQTSILSMAKLVEKGIKISIDDFGTGYSSLSYLKRFPLSVLKIDRNFIKDIPEDTDDIAISKTIISLARGLGLKVIAEGVETEAQLDFCRTNGCDEIQGYYFSKPVTAAEFTKLLLSGKTL